MNTAMVMDEEEWINNHPPLQDGARLQALEAKQMYAALVKWHTKKIKPILHQEKLDEAKNKLEETTGLRPTNEKLLKSHRTLKFHHASKTTQNKVQIVLAQDSRLRREPIVPHAERKIIRRF